MAAGTTMQHRWSSKLLAMLVLIIVLQSGACVYLLLRNRHATQKQTAATTDQATALAAELQDTVLLPSEQPSLATVLDRTKLGNPQLISQAQNGDQLLVYPKARRLILYRPGTRQVVDMFHVELPLTAPEHSGTTGR